MSRKASRHSLVRVKRLAPKVRRGPESPKLGGEVDPITISDESRDGPCSTGDRAVDKVTKVPRVEGQTPWPIGLHSVEEEKKKTEEEQRRRKEEKQKKEEEEEE